MSGPEQKSLGLEESPSAPRHPTILTAKDLVTRGKLREAEQLLIDFIQDTDDGKIPENRLDAYSFLLRIPFEIHSPERVHNYIEDVKRIPLASDRDRAKFGKCLYSAGIVWYSTGNHEKARQSFQQALEIGTNSRDSELVFLSRFMLTDIKRTEGKFQEVLAEIDSLRDAAKASPDAAKNTAMTQVLLGNVYRKSGKFTQAIECFESAREGFSANKNSSDYHYTLWAIGTCYAALEDREKAKIYLELAASDSKDFQFWRINVMAQLTLAQLYTVLGDYGNAEATLKKSDTLVGNDEASYFGRRLLRSRTLLAIKKGEFDTANELIDRLVIMAVREKNNGEIMRLRLLKAEVLLRTGESAQHEEAITMLQEALAYYGERGVLRHRAVVLELLARLDSRSGYPADANKKIHEMFEIASMGGFERLAIRAELARFVLERKLGQALKDEEASRVRSVVTRLNLAPERVILSRFTKANYEEWTQELRLLDAHGQRYVNEFFEDFHFVPNQTVDIEIDKNSHYVREKHLGEIPFHNKFTLMRILLLLAETPGREFSKEQLANEIWEQEYNPLRHDNNIYININRLRKLIEPNPRESRYVMNGPRGYYFNPAMKVNISSKISDVAPRSVLGKDNLGGKEA